MVRYSCRINTTKTCALALRDPRPGQGDIFAPARNLVWGLGKIWGDFFASLHSIDDHFLDKNRECHMIWVIWCFSGLVFFLLTMFFF